MLYKVTNIGYCAPCDGMEGRGFNLKMDRNVPLHKKSKTDNSELRKKIFESSTFHCFCKESHKIHEILSNSLKRCSHQWGRPTEDTKPK